MKRIMVALALASVFGSTVPTATAGDWSRADDPPQQEYPVLKKLVVGAALFGIGFAAGRLTAPKPTYGYDARYGAAFEPGRPPLVAPQPGCAPPSGGAPWSLGRAF